MCSSDLQRHDVATGVDDIISLCETAIAKLKEAAATLLQEPGDAVETIYGHVFEVVPPGLDSPLLGPAARLVDALFKFNGPGPLAGAIVVAGDLVHDTFSCSAPEGGPLQSACRELGYLIHVPHVNAFNLFTAYADTLGVPPVGIGLCSGLFRGVDSLSGPRSRSFGGSEGPEPVYRLGECPESSRRVGVCSDSTVVL